jgi:hypothetical protein
MFSFHINGILPVAFRFTLFSILLQNIQKLIETNKNFFYFETTDVHKSSELNLFTEPNVSNGTNKKQSEI